MKCATTASKYSLCLEHLLILPLTSDLQYVHNLFGRYQLQDTNLDPELGLKKSKILTHVRCNMDDARLAVETGVDGVDVVIGTSSFLMEHSHGKDMAYM
jgi:hypothetical protein